MSEEIEEQIEGMVDKDKKYRDRLIANIKHKKDHPFHNGIHMAAHHLISKSGVTESELGEALVHKGYNINMIENLVFLPSTPQGACQLRVQLHRYDHTYSLSDQEPYHDQVASLLSKLEKKILKCTQRTKKDSSEVQNLLNQKSEEILQRIAEFRVPLTSIFRNFKSSSKIGCANQLEIDDSNDSFARCTSERSHTGEVHNLNPYAKKRKLPKMIKYQKSYYKLKVGN
ncbi:AHH domain-containing protein [Pseudoalteromonas piscicida]|uniref:AHH domain-containing protein n=1 Tax=Pseudoalteromonas TaxID=53246 RepID=UPI001BAB4198|nr:MULTISPECIES: AHH domain-containing protein [Pseudoalteromonas]QUI72317.1 hypothetical protein GSF13_22525 [Pseudoalteromonas sp. M8]UDM60350.1 AHH domain-containing protein [Pseudoalteromonas piscicida]